MPKVKSESKELQGTCDWFEQRRGRFTGSQMDKLMSCGRSTAKLEWGRPEKLIDLGDTAKKYIFAKAMERKRGKVVKTPTSKTMNYGTEQEDVVGDILEDKYPGLQKCGFIEFIKDVAGSSPDRFFPEQDFGVEIKCSTDWDGLYKRHVDPFDQSSDDFWQLQCEMLSLKVNKILYVVAEPSEDIFDPHITDLSEQFIYASDIHQKVIIQRCLLGDIIIKEFLSQKDFRLSYFHEAVRKCCSDFNL